MNYRQGLKTIKNAIAEHSTVSYANLIRLLDGDENLFQDIREDLLDEQYAIDTDMTALSLPDWQLQEKPKAYDIFLSYAHLDNTKGRVEELIQILRRIHRKFNRDRLHIFFDREGIKNMEDWEHKIYLSLKQAKVMITLLSPNYFNSVYCRKEWERFIEQEMDYALHLEGISPLYTIQYDEFERNVDELKNEWLKDLKRRQYEDIREWWNTGMTGVADKVPMDVEKRFMLLEQQYYDKIVKAERHRDSITTIPPHNRTFVGRREVIRQIHEGLALDPKRTIVVIQGMAGMGKSALAFEYAHLYGKSYPGGRYLVNAENLSNLRTGIIALAEDKGVKLSDEERKHPKVAYQKVRSAFESGPASLILLDNIDDVELLNPYHLAYDLPQGHHVHILATTRLSSHLLDHLMSIRIEELTAENGLRLLEKYQLFLSEAEKYAAQEIVGHLDGYPLGLEVVGIFLKLNKMPYQKYLTHLKQMNIAALDEAGKHEEVQLSRHKEKIVSQVLAPALEELSESELKVLQYSSLLPSDQVALPWLNELLIQEAITIQQLAGLMDPWKLLLRKLKGLGFFNETQEVNIVRMHRVLQAVIRKIYALDLEKVQERLSTYIQEQANKMTRDWHQKEKRWMIAPLVAYCRLKLTHEQEEGAELSNYVFQLQMNFGLFNEAYELLIKAKEVIEKIYKPPHPSLGSFYSNLASCEKELGNHESAKKWLLKALKENDEIVYQPPHSNLGIGFSNLAMIERDLGNYSDAKKWMLKALDENETKIHQPPHCNLGRAYSNLALIERDLGNYKTAKECMLKALKENWEKIHKAPHPSLGTGYIHLATIEEALGNNKSAKDLILKALEENFEEIYSPPHPDLGTGYANLAQIEKNLGNNEDAKILMIKALKDNWEKTYQPPHPYLGKGYTKLATIEQALGNNPAAKEWIIKALEENLEKIYHPPHPDLGIGYSKLAEIEKALSNNEAARKYLLRSLDENNLKIYSPPHLILGIGYINLGGIEQDLGDNEAAKKWLLKGLEENFEKIYLPPHPDLGIGYSNLASIERNLGNNKAAKKLMLKALEDNYEKIYQPPHPYLSTGYSNLALIEKDLGNNEAAKKWMLKALEENNVKAYQPPHPILGENYYFLAITEYRLNNKAIAIRYMQKSHEHYLGFYGKDHRHTKIAENYLKDWQANPE